MIDTSAIPYAGVAKNEAAKSFIEKVEKLDGAISKDRSQQRANAKASMQSILQPNAKQSSEPQRQGGNRRYQARMAAKTTLKNYPEANSKSTVNLGMAAIKEEGWVRILVINGV